MISLIAKWIIIDDEAEIFVINTVIAKNINDLEAAIKLKRKKIVIKNFHNSIWFIQALS